MTGLREFCRNAFEFCIFIIIIFMVVVMLHYAKGRVPMFISCIEPSRKKIANLDRWLPSINKYLNQKPRLIAWRIAVYNLLVILFSFAMMCNFSVVCSSPIYSLYMTSALSKLAAFFARQYCRYTCFHWLATSVDICLHYELQLLHVLLYPGSKRGGWSQAILGHIACTCCLCSWPCRHRQDKNSR